MAGCSHPTDSDRPNIDGVWHLTYSLIDKDYTISSTDNTLYFGNTNYVGSWNDKTFKGKHNSDILEITFDGNTLYGEESFWHAGSDDNHYFNGWR